MATTDSIINVWDHKLKKYVTVKVQINVDFSQIAERLASRAYASKGKRAVSVHGAVELKII